MTTQADWRDNPVLEGAHVRLEPLTLDHAPGVLAAADDPEIFRWLAITQPTTAAEADAVVERYLTLPGVQPWAQVERATGHLAGLTTYYDVVPELRTVAIGFTWLTSRVWRTPFNTEAKLLLLTRAFDDLGCVRVVWHTDHMNERSQAAIARLGARREGVMRRHKIRPDGSWRDTVIFSMLDDEWPAARDALRARLAP